MMKVAVLPVLIPIRTVMDMEGMEAGMVTGVMMVVVVMVAEGIE